MAKCYDCGLDYDDFPCDMLIQDNLWEIISPYGCSSDKGGGLLCPNCMCKRIINIKGMTCVRVTVDTSELIKDTPND